MVQVSLRFLVNYDEMLCGLFKLVLTKLFFLNSFYFSIESAHTDHSSRAQQKGPPPPSLSYESKCIICHLHSAGLLACVVPLNAICYTLDIISGFPEIY